MKRKSLKLNIVLILDAVLIAVLLLMFVMTKTPEEVSGLSVSGTTYDSAEITWSASENAEGYIVFRSEDGEKFERIGITEETDYTDTDLVTGKTYSYIVASYNGIKRRTTDKNSAVTAEPALDTPQLKVSTKKGEIKLNITAVDGATGYEIYRNDVKIADQSELSFIDKDADSDETIHYSVKAYRVQASESAAKDTEKEALPADETKEPVTEEPFTAYSGMSKDVKAKLVSAGDLEAEIKGQDIVFTWEPSDKYASFKLYKGNDLLTETSGTEYTLTDFDPEEQYKMKLVGYMEDGKTKSPENIQTFKISTETKTNEEAIDAACEWGVNIADDDSFAYGECPRALHNGCYFCKTNGKKGKGYEKTYICNSLVHACFAHGAGDPEMLKACKQGDSVGMTEKSYTRYGDWKKVKKPSKSSLKKGDVLVANKSIGGSDFHHVALYIGDGKVLEATRKGWSAESIAVRPLAGMYYDRYDFVMRYTGNGDGVKYTVEEIPE